MENLDGMLDNIPKISTSWHSYPSIFNLGHKALENLFTVPVNVEEKYDGSQFSFGIFNGEIKVRSKGAILHPEAPEKMFTRAVDTVKELAPFLHDGWTYRAEYLSKPKHNTLAYERVPEKHLIVFDINIGHEAYLSYDEKWVECKRIGLECAKLIVYRENGCTNEQFHEYLKTPSALGGQTVEGVVVKPSNYNLFGLDKKVLMGKFVSEVFKEAHSLAWKETSPNQGDILERLIDTYAVQGRWMKAVQHMAERGEITDSPKDIGMLLKEVGIDIEKECKDEIMKKLWEWAAPHVRRGATRGLPQWYKDFLLRKQFKDE